MRGVRSSLDERRRLPEKKTKNRKARIRAPSTADSHRGAEVTLGDFTSKEGGEENPVGWACQIGRKGNGRTRLTEKRGREQQWDLSRKHT